MYGYGPAYFIAFAVMYNWFNRGRAFYYILFITICGWMVNITKMAYSEPRPFMVSKIIIPYGCSSEFGNPSGHALWATGFHWFLFLDICHASQGPKRSKLTYAILLFFTLALSFLIGFARWYVGVHTVNQIVYGWLIGLWIAFYLHFCIRDQIIHHVDSMLEGKIKDVPYFKYTVVASFFGISGFLS